MSSRRRGRWPRSRAGRGPHPPRPRRPIGDDAGIGRRLGRVCRGASGVSPRLADSLSQSEMTIDAATRESARPSRAGRRRHGSRARTRAWEVVRIRVLPSLNAVLNRRWDGARRCRGMTSRPRRRASAARPPTSSSTARDSATPTMPTGSPGEGRRVPQPTPARARPRSNACRGADSTLGRLRHSRIADARRGSGSRCDHGPWALRVHRHEHELPRAPFPESRPGTGSLDRDDGQPQVSRRSDDG